MESIARLVRTWMVTEEDSEVMQTVADLSSGKAALIDVVKALGEYLPSEDDSLRAKGVTFLSNVLEKAPASCVNSQATHMLSIFYTNKLEDTATTVPALGGILSLIRLPTISSLDITLIFKAMKVHLNMKALTQSARYVVFRILDSLVAHHRVILQRMGSEFIEGYISIVDGEKDPRNLMLAFAIDRVLCIEFDISGHVEDMFNIIFCYFPITFRLPKDDPYGISPDDLTQALRLCLCASAFFGQLAFPLFLEKLYAGSPATKGDILESIALCLPIYGCTETRTFAKKLWTAIKLEIFQPVNPEIEGKALNTTKTLVKTLYEEGEERSAKPKGLITEILDECTGLLTEPEKSQAVPAGKVVAALIGTTPSVTRLVLQQTIPLLVSLFRKKEEIPNRPQILTLLCLIVTVVEGNQAIVLADPESSEELQSYKDDVLGVFVAGIQSDDSREAAIEGLKKLIKIEDVMKEEEITYIVHTITEVLHDTSENADSSSGDALELLVDIASKGNSKIIEESTLPIFFSSLPDSAPSRTDVTQRLKYWQILRWLEKLCTNPPLFETFVVRLTTKLDLIFSTDALRKCNGDLEPVAAYAYCILTSLAAVLRTKEIAKHTDIPKYIDRLMPNLYNLIFYLSLAPESGNITRDNSRLTAAAATVVTLITRSLSNEQQEKLSADLQLAYFNREKSRIASGFQRLPEHYDVDFFNASPETMNLVVMFAAPVVAFKKGVIISNTDPAGFLKRLQLWSLDKQTSERTAAYHLIAATLNKNVEVYSTFIEYQLTEFWSQEIVSKQQETSRRRNAIESWLWILRSLVVRCHDSVMSFVTLLLLLFSDSELAWDAARAIGRAVASEDDLLDKKNFAIVKVLHAQRYFLLVLPSLLELVKGPTNDPQLRAALVAISFLISSLPKSVYVNEMPKLMVNLIKGLDLPDAQIRASIFDTFVTVAETSSAGQVDGPGMIAEHASTLATAAIRNALPHEISSVKLRISALRLLEVLPKAIRYDILHPLKPLVLRELVRALDDPKRAVRKEAIDARTAWFLYKG